MSAHRQGVWFWGTCPPGLVTCANCGGASRDKCHPPPRCGPLPKSLTGPQTHIFSCRERWISKVQNLILILQYKLKMRATASLAWPVSHNALETPLLPHCPYQEAPSVSLEVTSSWAGCPNSWEFQVPTQQLRACQCQDSQHGRGRRGWPHKRCSLRAGGRRVAQTLPKCLQGWGAHEPPRQLRAFPASSYQQACQMLAGPCGRTAAGPGGLRNLLSQCLFPTYSSWQHVTYSRHHCPGGSGGGREAWAPAMPG